jgi:hypothetical protein
MRLHLGSDDGAKGGRDCPAFAPGNCRRGPPRPRRIRRCAPSLRPDASSPSSSSWEIAKMSSPGGRNRSQERLHDTVGIDSAGVSTLAFWVAQHILDGRKDIPHDLLVPYLAFTQDDFEAALPNIPVGGVASHEYTHFFAFVGSLQAPR